MGAPKPGRRPITPDPRRPRRTREESAAMNRLCKVLVVDDGQRAIEVCRRTLPDVVLMDIEMPGLDGLSAARQIARDPGTPVIILTAHGLPNLIDQAVEDGVASYLLKPVTTSSLHAALQVTVARTREMHELRENVNTLELTLRERKLIERAKGILMTRRNLGESEAFRLLQRQSQDRRMPMAKLAESIVQADELLESSPQPTEPARRGPLGAARDDGGGPIA